MEPWQKSHIRNNLVNLYKMTTCNNTLLALLQQEGALSTEEVEELSIPYKAGSEKCRLLYDILMTRTSSYILLVQALKDTNQTGALEILQTYESKYQHLRSITVEKHNIIGTGSNGIKVYGGKFGGRDVAVKVQMKKFVNIDLADNEIRILLKFDFHPNVVRYFTTETDDDFIYIVLERCAISLQDEVKANVIKMNEENIIRQCTQGLDHLHTHNVIHGDLKPGNILLTVNHEVKISDFGLSKPIPNGDSSVTAWDVGSVDWMAPEILKCCYVDGVQQRIKVNIPADIFALGCIFYFTLSKGNHPYGTDVDIPFNIKHNKPTLDILHDKIEWLLLIKTMISHAAEERPTTKDILRKILIFSQNKNFIKNAGFQTCLLIDEEPLKFTHSRRGGYSSYRNHLNLSLQKQRQPIPESMAANINNEPHMKHQQKTRRAVGNGKVVKQFNKKKKSANECGNWKKFTLHWESTRLAEVVTFSAEFLKLLSKNGVLTWFTINRTMLILKHGQREQFFQIPFCTSNYYDCLKMAFRETRQYDALDILVAGDSKSKWWVSRQAYMDGSNFDLMAEAIGYNCDALLLQELLENVGITPLKQTDDLGTNLLHIAAGCGNIDVIEYLISVGFDVNAINKNHHTPLHFLGWYGSNVVEATTVLLNNGANLYSIDKDKDTVAHTVCLYVTDREFSEWAEFMIRGGHHSIWTKKGFEGNTPVHAAVFNSKVSKDTLSLLSSKVNFDFNITNDMGNTILMLGALGGQSRDLLHLIVKYGGDWKIRDNKGRHVLHYAVESGNIEAVKYFLLLGANPDDEDKDLWTPLHFLYFSDIHVVEITRVFLKHKANLRARTRQGNTVAHLLDRKYKSKGVYLEWKEYVEKEGHEQLFLVENLKKKLKV